METLYAWEYEDLEHPRPVEVTGPPEPSQPPGELRAAVAA